MIKVYIFANCHGAHFSGILNHLGNEIEIHHDVSFANLNNFEKVIENAKDADVLIIQPISKYESFSVSNIKRH